MYQNSIADLPNLASEKYENIFQVYLDENGRYFYNLLEAMTLPTNLPVGFFDEYIVEPNDTYPFIAWKLYRSINLWWVVCVSNNIQDPTKELPVGTKLRVPNTNFVQLILKEINV